MKLKIKLHSTIVCYTCSCDLTKVYRCISENKLCCMDCVVESIVAKF